jgi:muramoyltetrapeptide carboxypeptidase LdcA involved in peptidoglycan recycling
VSRALALPPTCRPGDRIAVVSPAWAGPAAYPNVHDQGLRRIRDLLGLQPVEYPTTRRQGTPRERARDLMAAFTDPSIRAVLATIGGDDQLTVLAHLDPDQVAANPKAFVGFSDNTNLLNWLWNLGIAGWHGSSTMVHLGPGPGVDPSHLASLRAALFGAGDLEIVPFAASRDYGIAWDDPRSVREAAPVEAVTDGWTWHGPATTVTGPTWGGNLEILEWTLAIGRHVRPPQEYAGCILLLETSEEHPDALAVYRMLRNMGERGLLGQMAGILVARPQACERHDDPGPAERAAFRSAQREAVLQAVDGYAPGVPVVVGVEFGHTCPQWVLPYGGRMTLDSAGRRLVAHYGGPRP